MATVEKRVIASSVRAQRPGGGGVAPGADPGKDATKKKKKPKKKLLIIVVALVLVVSGAAYYLLVMSKASGAAAAPPAPIPGSVAKVTSVSLNLASGHYLRLGLGLQLTSTADAKTFDTSKAVDLAISLYSERTVDEVTVATSRDTLKAQLLAEIEKAYPEEVMGLYFTDYVTQ